MSYAPTLGRWIQQDPAGYVDGLHLYQYVLGCPTSFVDPFGLEGATTQPTTNSVGWLTTVLTVDTGSGNRERPWIGAAWTLYTPIPDDGGNPGLVRSSRPKVGVKSPDNYRVICNIALRVRIELRNTDQYKQVIRNISGERLLTDEGRGIYGHEQLHLKDFILQLQVLVNRTANELVDEVKATDGGMRAQATARAMQLAIDAFVRARSPGASPDITHGGPNQPVAGKPYPPEGEPGDYESVGN